jgi:short-subunit dehydrogenase
VRIDGARALVTGASSGIGAATVELLNRRGAQVRSVGRNAAALTGKSLAVDLVEPGAAERIADWAGDVDLLVCNAGQGWAGALADMALPEIERLVTLNLLAPLALTRLLLPAMQRGGRGHVVLVSSIAGVMGVADEAVYAAAKGGLRTFADSIRLAAAADGVGVSVIVPGVVDTPFFERRGRPYDRKNPRPVPATQVAQALVTAVERNRAEVFVPAWLGLPARLHGLAPDLVRRLRQKFG